MFIVEQNDTTSKMRTSLTIVQFHELLRELPTLRSRFTNESDASETLFMYLMKIRTGASHEEIGSHFTLSKYTISRRIQIARAAMLKVFLPLCQLFPIKTRHAQSFYSNKCRPLRPTTDG